MLFIGQVGITCRTVVAMGLNFVIFYDTGTANLTLRGIVQLGAERIQCANSRHILNVDCLKFNGKYSIIEEAGDVLLLGQDVPFPANTGH
jgi:hypothetical protein